MTEAIHAFNHQAMSTWWQVRVSGHDQDYAAQAMQAAFAVTDRMEALMSRFRDDSEITAIANLPAGGRARLSKEVFDCLSLAREVEELTGGAFDPRAAARLPRNTLPRWRLDRADLAIVVDSAPCRLDLGAIAKGFALDRMASELAEWGIQTCLLMSSGSSILAGAPPPGDEGWRIRLDDGEDGREVLLAGCGIGTSGTAMRGEHIIDPSTGMPSSRHLRASAISGSAAEADALSTAWMTMDWDRITACCASRGDLGAVILDHSGEINVAGRAGVLFRE